MKRLIIPLILILLTGCASIKTGIENQITSNLNEKLVFGNDKDYLRYKEMADNNELTENGIKKDDRYSYIIENVDTENLDANEIETYGDIHITFIRNNLINIDYYNDENHTERLGDECYKNIGETIYVSIPRIAIDYDDIYEYDGLKIININIENNSNSEIEKTDSYAFTVPECDSKELAIEPYGHFKDVSLTLYDYYLNDEGIENELPGVWTINNQTYQEKTINIGKTKSYSISYKYDDDEYYVSFTRPESYYSDKGFVSFRNGSLKSDDGYYVVQLSKYLSLTIDGDINKGIESIMINGKDTETDSLAKVKYGDRIEITTKANYLIVNRILRLEGAPQTLNAGGTRYCFIVPEGISGNHSIEVSNKVSEFLSKEIENGKLEVRYKSTGIEVDTNDSISDSEELIIKIIANPGYYVDGKDVSDGVFETTIKYSDYKKKIDKIISDHKCLKYTQVFFDFTDEHGDVLFDVDGNPVNNESLLLRKNQIISLNYSITDKDYVIKRTSINLLSDKYSERIKIKVSDLKNGSVISREQYIDVEKRGNE